MSLTTKKKKFKYQLIPVINFQDQVFREHQSKVKIQKEKKPIANINVEEFEILDDCFNEISKKFPDESLRDLMKYDDSLQGFQRLN